MILPVQSFGLNGDHMLAPVPEHLQVNDGLISNGLFKCIESVDKKRLQFVLFEPLLFITLVFSTVASICVHLKNDIALLQLLSSISLQHAVVHYQYEVATWLCTG